MQYILHKAESRGHANHGWLNSHHTFSFANYYDPERVHFGALRVLNDDIVDPGKGFSKHPHDNMEIISIPLYGELEHEDNMGNKHVIYKNDVQVMSAGSGIQHSEYNRSKDKRVNFLQIWIFPKIREVQPRYGQMSFNPNDRINRFQQVVSPKVADEGVWIYQDAWVYLADFEKGKSVDYLVKKVGNGVYFFVLSGSVQIADVILERRDGLGIWDVEKIQIFASSQCELLVLDVPMTN